MPKHFIGCDPHKAVHYLCVMLENGEVIKKFEVENSPFGFQKALNEVEKYPDRVWGLENSANFAKQFRKYLFEREERLKEVNPVFTSQRRSKSTRKSKSDLIDSIAIAKVLRDDFNYLPDIVVKEDLEELKSILDQRDSLVKETTRIKNWLHAKLINIDSCYKNKITGFDNLKNIEKAENVIAKYGTTMAELALRDIKILKILKIEIEELEKLLLIKESENKLIQNYNTIKGVATLTACKLYSILGNLSQFKTPDQLGSYSAASPISKSSAGRSKNCINKGGNRELYEIVRMIADNNRKHTKEGKEYYNRKLAEGKTKGQAMRCLMKQMIKIIWVISRNNVPYNYIKPEKALKKALTV